ncbi:hypothetical protein [Acidianus ambivalens]|uniref:Uncharacterized protein n=1 Tax=Acidianus ambivalens TaxID=2283 RepID=A0A650CWA6_ACIAM|nr:hypothetical protein [Acidianus ambivalens]MQL54299.1 hypothetical protein [Acidianus ambivalens]QGR22126.1 hypothetical protein D1866_09140 [Acidianus ambivalens]
MSELTGFTDAIKRLHAACLAIVMGIGIISIDAQLPKFNLISVILMWIDLLSYTVLFIFYS